VWSFRKKDEVKKRREAILKKHVSNLTDEQKDKIIMTLFLKAKWEKTSWPIMKLILPFYFLLGVELDLFDGKAYISLVGFMFKDTNCLMVKFLIWHF
jgi:uncharacterized protein YqjF (DUF2071 family)